MDPKIEAIFNDDILNTARGHYSIATDNIRLLDGFESFIYEFDRDDGQFILRIGHSHRRSPDLIRGEVDWINYLAANNVTVARAILSQTGNLVEPIEDGHGGQFLCTSFVKAPGGPANDEHINEQLFRNYGRLLGQMHALAKTYQPSDAAWKRQAWDDPLNNTPDRQLPQSEKIIRQKYQSVFEHLQTLPREKEGYGLIHQDVHLGNLFVDEDYTLTLFDFDDAVYGHFIYDIAMVLFYIVMWDINDTSGFTKRFMPTFLQGYREHNDLDPRWLAEIPYFLKLREIDLFAAILFTEGENPDDEWGRNYMDGRRAKIENDVPYIEYDWDLLEEYL